MLITRFRYVVMRNNRTEIHCGNKNVTLYCPLSEVGNKTIQTYGSHPDAVRSARMRGEKYGEYEVVKVIERIEGA